ncbi:MAG TPA: GNAT family N-acyltransferase [Bauldia sp.]|nr:GNAT family N-acyltransferase [Bauldia sp.]
MAYLPLMQQRLVEGMRRYRRRFDTLAGPLGRLGTLEVRLARSVEEVKRAQRLRYRVFYEEMSAVTNVRTLVSGRDRDPFDRFCDHLLVIDHGEDGQTPEIVGTYRLLRQEVAQQNRGFYSSGEFELDKLVKRHPDRNFLELGRSCVLPPYRTKRTVELLWHGIWAYVRRHNIDVMVGCASLEGTDAAKLAPYLAFVRQIAPTPEEWRVRALPGLGVNLDHLPDKAASELKAMRGLPPLLKGYLRLGAYVGEDAVVDRQFGTTDVFLVLPNERINQRYINFYGADASRHSAEE